MQNVKLAIRTFLIAGLLSLDAAIQCLGQGTILFYNHVPEVGLNAPIFDVGGLKLVDGFRFVAELYAGPTESNLTPVGLPAPFQSGPGAGYWTVDTGLSLGRTIFNVAPGETAFVQVKVWLSVPGLSYDDIVAQNGKHGESQVFTVTTGGVTDNDSHPPTLPAYMTDLHSFTLTGVELAIPEPTTVVLVALAGGLIGLSRKFSISERGL